MLRMPLIYYCLSRGITSEKEVRFAVWVLIFSVFIQSALSIAQTFGGSFSWLQRLVEMDEQVSLHQIGTSVYGRAYGTIGYTTVFAQYLGMISPLALAFFVFKKVKWEYFVSGLVYILAIVAMILSLSRAEWGNLIVVFILILLMGIRKKIFQDRTVKLRVLTVFLGAVLIGLIFSPRLIARLSSEDYSSALERIPMAKVALSMIVHNPILGVGLNNYAENMYSYGMGRLLPGQVYGVHNSFLFLAAEIGIFGLLAILYLWIISYRRLIFCFKNGEPFIWIISAGLICGLTALFIHSNVEQGFHVHQQLNGMLWSFFGIAAALKVITVDKIKGS
jgi:O-antigen ligase